VLRPSHSALIDQPNDVWWTVQSMKSPMSSLLHFPVNCSFLGPNIPISLFLNLLKWTFQLIWML
jgi:hypothetical protein